MLKDIERLYDIRSRLAHGSASPWNEEDLRVHTNKAEQMTVRVLFGAMLYYGSLKAGGGTDKELEKSFSPPAAGPTC